MMDSMEALLAALAAHHAYRALRQARRQNWFLNKLREHRLRAGLPNPAEAAAPLPAGHS
jgi:hypothetical protein